MPFININIAKQLSAEKKDALQQAVTAAITLIPTKLPEQTTVCVRDGCAMYKNGAPLDGGLAEVRLFKSSPADAKRAYTQKLFSIFDEIAGIPKSGLTVNVFEFDQWGSGGTLNE